MNEYADFLKGAGFDVKARNMSEWFIQILDMELGRLEVENNSFYFFYQFYSGNQGRLPKRTLGKRLPRHP